MSSTLRYRNSSAESAWLRVVAATRPRTVRSFRNAVTSTFPISRGWRGAWNRTKRRIQATYVSSVRGLYPRARTASRTLSSSRGRQAPVSVPATAPAPAPPPGDRLEVRVSSPTCLLPDMRTTDAHHACTRRGACVVVHATSCARLCVRVVRAASCAGHGARGEESLVEAGSRFPRGP